MNIGYLYFLLPVILFPAISTINVLFGRQLGAKKMSLYRQLTVTIVGSPLLIGILQKPELLEKHALIIVLCGFFGAMYLTTAFYAMNLTLVGISRSFVAVSRTVAGFVIGYFFFQESISFYDILGTGVIFLGVFILSQVSGESISKKDIMGILASLLAGVIFSINTLIFKLFAKDFPAIEAAYLLECSSLLFILVFIIITKKKSLKESLSIQPQKIGILFMSAPFLLLASYGLAKSVNLIPFYIFNTLFILVLIISMILSWIFLHEKFTLKQLIAMGIMVGGCGIVILF